MEVATLHQPPLPLPLSHQQYRLPLPHPQPQAQLAQQEQQPQQRQKRPSQSQPQPQRKKRSRPTSDSPEEAKPNGSAGEDDGNDRKRGRPRVDKNDESAADRRRTQIRMAQRAYRQRKESTLEELRSRVTDLSDVLARVHQAFESCSSTLSASGLAPEQLVRLQETAGEIEGLMRTAGGVEPSVGASGVGNGGGNGVSANTAAAPSSPAQSSSSSSAGSGRRSIKASTSPPLLSPPHSKKQPLPTDYQQQSQHQQQQPQSQPQYVQHHQQHQQHSQPQVMQEDPAQYARRQVKNVVSWLDPATVEESTRARQRMDISLGYSLYPSNVVEEIDDDAATGSYLPTTTQTLVTAHSMPTSHPPMQVNTLQQQQHQQPDMRLFTQVSPLRSLCDHETSFPRWLHRFCTELGYQLLVNPARKPTTYERVFRLNLLCRDRTQLSTSFKDLIFRDGDDSLDNWQAPLLHVGGAGTHFPRRDRSGRVHPPKKAYGIGMVGPQQPFVDFNGNSTSLEMAVTLTGCEGEWFDPHDVQGYVESKGISLNPGAGFTTAELVEWPTRSPLSSSSSCSSYDAPMSEGPPWNGEQLATLSLLGVDLGRWDEASMTVAGPGCTGATQHGPLMTSGSATTTPTWHGFSSPTTTADPLSSAAVAGKFDDGCSASSSSSAAAAAEFYNPSGIPVSMAQGQVSSAPLNCTAMAYPSFPTTALSSSAHGHAGFEPLKRNVIIDIDRFIKVLANFTVCLGRAPGFRRKDVDRALALASFDADVY